MYYIAHRLFSLHDRAFGALVADLLADRVGANNVFLPFCDTDEEALTSEQKGRLLYDLDRDRLDRIDGMIALLHGPSLDDGVCMEIGYAVATGVPVVVLTTDFQTYGLAIDGSSLQFPDPLIEIVAPDIVRVATMAPPRSAGHPRTTSYRQYHERNADRLREAGLRAVDRLKAQERSKGPAPAQAQAPPAVTFIELSPYLEGSARPPEAVALARHGRAVRVAGRFTADTAKSPMGRARADWEAALHCESLVVDVRGPECPAGAALLVGAATRRRIPVIGRITAGSYTFAPGREANRRNLMIHYSMAQTYSSDTEFERLLDEVR